MSEWKTNPMFPGIQYQDDFLDLTKIEDLIVKETGPTEAMQQAWTHAMLYGSGAYTLGMDTGRGQSKSVLRNMALHGTTTGRMTGQQANMVFIDDHEPRSKTMHVFHHKRGYSEMPNGSPSKAPNHCYFLWYRQWYKKTSETKVRAIPLSKVPKEHRLFLMISGIDQPEM